MTSNEAHITRIVNWVALGVAGLLALVVASDIFKRNLFSDTEIDPSILQFNDLPGSRAKPLVADTSKIIAQHIFGKKPVAPPKPRPVAQAAQAKPKPKPRAPLKITLSGLIEGSTPETGMIMMSEGRKTLLVSVGEELGKTGAILKEVYPSKIVVDRNGYEEEVSMKRKELEINTELADMPVKGGGISISGNLDDDRAAHNAATRRQSPQGKMGGLPLPNSLKNL